MSAGMTTVEVLQGMTGHEEEAVATAFGATLEDLADNATRLTRALVFVVEKRGGKSAKDAKAAALDLTRKDLGEYFVEEPDELMPDEPFTESGKG
ncbi:hypothetical protein CLV56_4002 [Mumia flava]|uniref:Uncharacterized protein n=1 Tax=Mumia flava TaxID=1348852 RepID=A0A0B2BNN9_9ACTN|nr:hypothetical protein [Mumia flava]PJJ48297.1 hypothetical protein CLV56_4002 [Mumia flava]